MIPITKSVATAEWLGKIEYQTALDLQQSQVARHKADPDTADKLFLLEHPPTYTFGASGKAEHLLIDDNQLAAEGITVHHIRRGGDITYHGPGQLVGYPILNLRRLYQNRGFDKLKLHDYLRELEETIIQTIAHFGLDGWRYPGYTGVWVGDEANPSKIAAIGIHVNSKGISSHGFALNVNPNMTHFSHIIPCGIDDHPVTSLDQETSTTLSVLDVLEPITKAFADVMGIEVNV